MGRTNMTILAAGLMALVAMSLMMKHLLVVKKEQGVDPVVAEVSEVYSPRLAAPCEFEVEEREGGRRVGILTIQPRLHASRRRLATAIGHFVWRTQGQKPNFELLEVRCRKSPEDSGEVFTVSHPYSRRRYQSPRLKPKGRRARPATSGR